MAHPDPKHGGAPPPQAQAENFKLMHLNCFSISFLPYVTHFPNKTIRKLERIWTNLKSESSFVTRLNINFYSKFSALDDITVDS